MKKILFVIIAILCMSFAHAAFTTQVAGTIGSLTGVDDLSGDTLTVTIQSRVGVPVEAGVSPSSGTYSDGMTILSDSMSLEYATDYTYNLTTADGDFLFNFTTPAMPAGSIVWAATLNEGSMLWDPAVANCTNKVDEGVYTWRLPTSIELHQLFLDENTTTGMETSNYWSGVTLPLNSDDAYDVSMGLGHVGFDDKGINSNYVRCVRDQ